jgi:hypothetical protein
MNTAELMPPERELEDSRGDGWFVTRSGNKFFPLQPRAGEVLIEDVAFALSNISRFGGHVDFYSVAEHSCIISDALPAAYRLMGLMHDATEAYLGDCVRPLKHQLPQYRDAEHNLWLVIAEQYGLPATLPPIIKEYDNRALLAERNQLMPEGPNTRNWYWDHAGVEPLNVRIQCWPPIVARREFMKRYERLTK